VFAVHVDAALHTAESEGTALPDGESTFSGEPSSQRAADSTGHAEFKALLDKYARGEISSQSIMLRRGLDEQIRTCAGLAALVALDRIDEFQEQVKRALATGVTPGEIMDVLLELADLGVNPRTRALDIVRRAMDEPA
jgi:alkylhydroperoxidase/carboxymuconolactone decarboxylase family protein YurZ